MDVENFRQTFAAEYYILPQPILWGNLRRGQKFTLNPYGFSESNQRFEIYTKRTWTKAFLETHPDKPDYPIWKIVNPLKGYVYLIVETYFFND